MAQILGYLEASRKEKKIWKIAEELRNSEFKGETVNYVYYMLTSGEYKGVL